MSDARALLRQQRVARKIEHPQAAYSDAGKLLCTTCHEVIKAESLWETHLRNPSHRQNVQTLSLAAKARDDHADRGVSQTHKRKHGEDTEMADFDEAEEPAIRKKRSKADSVLTSVNDIGRDAQTDLKAVDASQMDKEEDRLTPQRPASRSNLTPPLVRRTSGTPAHGVEISIPSRPATPNPQREGSGAATISASSTPKITPTGRSPLVSYGSAASNPKSTTTASAGLGGLANAALPQPGTGRRLEVDEDEWAAFEAEMVHINGPLTGNMSGFSTDAVISAAPMTSEEIAAKSEEEEGTKKKLLADVEIANEQEEAARALEIEFDEMAALEARVAKLKELREGLRNGSSYRDHPGTYSTAVSSAKSNVRLTEQSKENVGAAVVLDDESDDEAEADDWMGFRSRA